MAQGSKNKTHTKGDINRGRKWAHSEIRNQVPSVNGSSSWWWTWRGPKHVQVINNINEIHWKKKNCAPSWLHLQAYTEMHGQENIKKKWFQALPQCNGILAILGYYAAQIDSYWHFKTTYWSHFKGASCYWRWNR